MRCKGNQPLPLAMMARNSSGEMLAAFAETSEGAPRKCPLALGPWQRARFFWKTALAGRLVRDAGVWAKAAARPQNKKAERSAKGSIFNSGLLKLSSREA